MSTTAAYNSAQFPADGRTSTSSPAGSAGWGVIKTSLVGVISFGVVPAVVWPGRFREIIEADSERMHAATDWASRIDNLPTVTDSLRSVVNGISPNGLLTIVPRLLALFAAIALGMQLSNGTSGLDGLYLYWFGTGWTDSGSGPDYFNHLRAIHTLWCAALSFAYAAQWIQVNLHRDAVRRFVKQFNRGIEPHGMLPVRMREPGGFRPLVIIGAIVFAQYGAWWGIPMLLAASAQSRYTLVTSRSLAVQFADRMSRVAARRSVERRCDAQGCRALLPLPAKFCPQCGRRVPEPMLDRMG